MGMEFMQLSAGGLELLEDLIRELACLQAHLDRVKSAREEKQKELLMREMKREGLLRCLVRGRFPIVGKGSSVGKGLSEEGGPELPLSQSAREEPFLKDLRRVILVDEFI